MRPWAARRYLNERQGKPPQQRTKNSHACQTHCTGRAFKNTHFPCFNSLPHCAHELLLHIVRFEWKREPAFGLCHESRGAPRCLKPSQGVRAPRIPLLDGSRPTCVSEGWRGSADSRASLAEAAEGTHLGPLAGVPHPPRHLRVHRGGRFSVPAICLRPNLFSASMVIERDSPKFRQPLDSHHRQAAPLVHKAGNSKCLP